VRPGGLQWEDLARRQGWRARVELVHGPVRAGISLEVLGGLWRGGHLQPCSSVSKASTLWCGRRETNIDKTALARAVFPYDWNSENLLLTQKAVAEAFGYLEDLQPKVCCEAREGCEDRGAWSRRDCVGGIVDILLWPLTRDKSDWGSLLWCELCVRQSAAMKDKPEALQRRADRQECRKRDRSRVLSRSLCRASSFTRVECVAEAVATVVSLF